VLSQRFKTLGAVLRKVGQEDPVRSAQNTMDAITERYELTENKEKGAGANAQTYDVLTSVTHGARGLLMV